MSNLVSAIIKLRPAAKFYILGDDSYENIVWEDTVQVKPTEEEVSAALTTIVAEGKLLALREERNKKLQSTDYLALSDQTLSPEMTAYRQALRDITNTYSSLDDVIWPTKPE